ncbi:esterase/lipase family protein [Brevibacillus choshinensis]|uniref:Acetyltransferase n=1 Tax=Brevibacillus choshinensis TaxID=54911 RepID=A0ABX7FPI8_BRECH|nr:acetyltransferase [Brevibacillus choshinensis]QRG67604.1 acetyltransferase [Brevibacillus choshinensis]
MQKMPIVFVPGLFGSMSDQIVSGTGDWNFGLAKTAYEPVISMLGNMGYRLGKELFIAFYDWRQPIAFTAEYLVQTIAWAKQVTGYGMVNVVCHSMGGLVARSYVQSDTYLGDVAQLIILATPNAGSPVSYCYWAGGKLPASVAPRKNLVELYMAVYLAYLERGLPRNKIEALHRNFPSLLDLAPARAYGDYLLEERDGMEMFVPYDYMLVKNRVLDELNSQMDVIPARGIPVTLVAGIGQSTIQYLKTVPSLSPVKWVDGRVVGSINSKMGDGNVMMDSVFALNGEKYVVEANHLDILTKSESILKYKLQ